MLSGYFRKDPWLKDSLGSYERHPLALEHKPLSKQCPWKGTIRTETTLRLFKERKCRQSDAGVEVFH